MFAVDASEMKMEMWNINFALCMYFFFFASEKILNLILWNSLTRNFYTTKRDFNDDTVFLIVMLDYYFFVFPLSLSFFIHFFCVNVY